MNKNMRIFLTFSFISRGLKAFWSCITPLALLDLGIKRDLLSTLGGLNMLLGLFGSIAFSKLNFNDSLGLF